MSLNDWSLPSRNELQSIVDYTEYNPSIDKTAFPDTKAQYYWSSTTFAIDTNSVWNVHFGYGGRVYFSEKTNYYYVRAVRSGH